ncbi:MAG TPA: hypothetical protein VIL86_15655 [Tepidisphaeraceae bacterium]|jgi:hypothetical protein
MPHRDQRRSTEPPRAAARRVRLGWRAVSAVYVIVGLLLVGYVTLFAAWTFAGTDYPAEIEGIESHFKAGQHTYTIGYSYPIGNWRYSGERILSERERGQMQKEKSPRVRVLAWQDWKYDRLVLPDEPLRWKVTWRAAVAVLWVVLVGWLVRWRKKVGKASAPKSA